MFTFLGMSIFWVSLIEGMILTALFVNEKEIIGAWTLLVFGVALRVICGVHVIDYIVSHPWGVAESILGYLLLGVVWGFAKWFFHVRDIREKFLEMKTGHTANLNELRSKLGTISSGVSSTGRPYTNGEKEYAQHDLDRAIRSFEGDVKSKLGAIPPSARENKAKITSWIGYWPISLLWTLLDDFLDKLFKRIFELFSGLFQRISNHIFKDIKLEISNDD